MEKLPKLLIKDTGDLGTNGAYLVTAYNLTEKEEHIFRGDNGEDFKLYIPTKTIQDQKLANPNTVIVQACFGNTHFKVGAKLMVEQNVLTDSSVKSNIEKNVFYTTEDGTELYRVLNYDVFFEITEDEDLIPREGVLLCEPVVEVKYSTTSAIVLPDSAKLPRRDIARVVKVWEGCKDYEEGDYILLNRGADWAFRWGADKKSYLKVDTIDNGVIARVDSDSWSITKREKRVY